MPFLLGQPQLDFFEMEQPEPAKANSNNTKIRFLFKFFMRTVV